MLERLILYTLCTTDAGSISSTKQLTVVHWDVLFKLQCFLHNSILFVVVERAVFVGDLRSWNVLEEETLFKTWLNDMESSNNSDWVTQPVENRLIKLTCHLV